MRKQIQAILDWKNSMVYVRYSDGSMGFDQSRNTTEEQRQAYLDAVRDGNEVRNPTSA